MKDRETIIENYIEGYNTFDVERMVKDFSDDIIFKNIQNGQTTMTLNGINQFIVQAETAKSYFSNRRQTISSIKHSPEKTEVEIEYFGVLATDFPNGMKKGQEIRLSGKSIFEFRGNKIISLIDDS